MYVCLAAGLQLDYARVNQEHFQADDGRERKIGKGRRGLNTLET